MVLRDAGDLRSAAEAHDHCELVLQHVHHAHNALVAIGRKGVEHRPAHAAGLGAQCHCLEDVGAAAEATVNEDGELPRLAASLLQGLHDLRQHLDAWAARVQLAATVVREHAAAEARLVGLNRILAALDTLQEHLHLGDTLQPRHVLPAEARVNVAADGARGTLRAIHLAPILVVTLHVGALLRELVAHVLLAAAELRGVHSDE
mmetsp:Transcript_113916/g.157785  ORF Transcript_113916/g.157785 Transcript_113916/m.157785 type:complete len:204 (-) Transcript_113916:310-921(-)